MNKKIRNIFLFIGVIAIIVMMANLDLSLASLHSLLQKAGIYFPLILLLWVLIYAVNTLSWRQILVGLDSKPIRWNTLYKITVSGFALNYITPGGLNGGEAYRVIALKEHVGVARASSSTLLFSIIHVGSHLLFWFIAFSIFIFYPQQLTYRIVFAIAILFCGGLIWLFHLLMKKGAMHLLGVLLVKIPKLGTYIFRFKEKHEDTLLRIDEEVRVVYLDKPKIFYSALGLEFLARLLGCFEISLLLIPLIGLESFLPTYLIMAIASFMANLLFFMPMQIGGREGGFTLAFSLLGYTAQYGLFVGLVVRLRELIWVVIGVLFISNGGRSKEVNAK